MSAAGILGAAGDLFGGIMGDIGESDAASAYKKAAAYAAENADVAQRSGDIQEAQARRQVYQSVSGQQADLAGAGVTAGGSSQYLRRASIQQGGMTQALIQDQTKINVQGFEAEEAADKGQAAAASAQGTSDLGSGILGAAGSILSII